MRLLFSMDAKNYNPNGSVFARPSVRAIIRREGTIAMVHSLKYDHYKFPGGGIEKGETHQDALCRETLEEAGLVIRPESIREYGYVHRIQKGKEEDIFVQDNYYYLCEVEPEVRSQNLDAYESEERFTLEFVKAQTAIEVNRTHNRGGADQIMREREARVLEYLLEEKLL